MALGFDAVATGHYARLVTGDDGLIEMHRAVDMGKDQSYVLGVLTQEQLAHSLFPLGDSRKPEVREEADRRGLSVANKPDSHDICFISDGDTAGWLREKLGAGSGEIVDHATGEVLGSHEGTFGFTIGQRKGLRIGRPAPDGRPRYVLDIEPVSGTVTVGPREELTVDHVTAFKPRWCGTVPAEPLHGTVQLRAHGEEHRAVVTGLRRRRDRRAARAGARYRARPGRGGLRGDAGGRVGHHHRGRAPAAGRRMTVVATGIGSMPGEDATAYAEALRLALGETPDLPFLPELPGRGAPASMTGRALAVVAELGADLQPAGWRLTDAPGVDHRRARSLLAQDLDLLEEQAQGFAGRLKAQVAGPWTLAATVERPKGGPCPRRPRRPPRAGPGAGRGAPDHVADLRRRVPGADLLVQVDEPALPTVLAGGVPTASGLHRHRTVHPPEASQALEWVFAAVREAGATPVAHCCAADAPVDLLLGAGAQGVSVDLDALRAGAYDALAGALEKGHAVMLGVVPATDPVTPPTDDAVTERVLRVLDMLGLDPRTAGDLVVTPSCGLAGAGAAWARRALALSERVARNLSTA